jgi:hypothetical protein
MSAKLLLIKRKIRKLFQNIQEGTQLKDRYKNPKKIILEDSM